MSNLSIRKALLSLLRTHLGFFTAQPHGRIMNRFSNDMGNVDELLSFALHECIDNLLSSVGTVVAVCFSVPPVIPVFLVLFYYMIRLRQFVTRSIIALKRLESVSKSPILDAVTASIRGVVCIRAFGREAVQQQKIVDTLDVQNRNWYAWWMANRFMGFRLDMVCVCILACSSIGGTLCRDFVAPELIGLTIVYSINMAGLFQYMVRNSVLVESFMTSFERLHHYEALPREADEGQHEPSGEFPREARIDVQDVHMRYRSDLPLVLKGLTFSLAGGSKVGVCGRTGSGKSSLFMALARLAEVTSGTLRIDGLDAASLSLSRLRRCISWVPQEPSFFTGSLRFNLDPHRTYADDTLWKTLKSVQMDEQMGDEGLELQISDGGSRFSCGERQLLSLARALLQHRRILCMDEAFANVDFETDNRVQAAVREMTSQVAATVLVIAHRMQTLADSDYVLVMEGGTIAEHGPPQQLLESGGTYSSMVRQGHPE